MIDTNNKIGIIGSGNMAYFLGTRLQHSSFPIKYVYARDSVEKIAFSRRINAIAVNDISELCSQANVIFLCVNDSAIEAVASQLKGFQNKILIHCSGTVPSAILAEHSEDYGVFWPIYSITKHNLIQHRDIPIFIEGNTGKSIKTLEDIAAEITNFVKTGNSKEKARLHLLAVMSNNFINHLIALCQDYAHKEQIDFQWIKPIIMQTVERIGNDNASKLQTGPAIRNDMTTIDKHKAMLSDDEELLNLYESISQSIINFYKKKNTL